MNSPFDAYDAVIHMAIEAINNVDFDNFERQIDLIPEIFFTKAYDVIEDNIEEFAARINIVNMSQDASITEEIISKGLKNASARYGVSALFIKFLCLLITTELYRMKKTSPEKLWDKFYKDIFKQIFGALTSNITEVYKMKKDEDKENKNVSQ